MDPLLQSQQLDENLFLGKTQCFNYDNQCLHGEENSAMIQNNLQLKNAFNESCNNVGGNIIRCCPLSLINVPYNPPLGVDHLHVKDERGNISFCPESIRSRCQLSRLGTMENVRLCQAEKCNDAGYLEADNFYQICKAYRANNENEIPDCSEKVCNQRMIIPDWFRATVRNNTQQAVQEVQQRLPPPPENQNKLLNSILSKLPHEDRFYDIGTLIFGVLAILLILILFALQMRQ